MEIFRKQNWQLCWTVKAFCQILRDLIFVLTSNLFSTGITNMEVQAAVRDPDLAAQYSSRNVWLQREDERGGVGAHSPHRQGRAQQRHGFLCGHAVAGQFAANHTHQSWLCGVVRGI